MALPSNCDVACLTLCSLAPPDRGRNPPGRTNLNPRRNHVPGHGVRPYHGQNL
jgi:hypothetical protein